MKTSEVVRSLTFLFSSDDERKQSMRLLAKRVALLEDAVAVIARHPPHAQWPSSVEDHREVLSDWQASAQAVTSANEDFWKWHDLEMAKWRDEQVASSPDPEVASSPDPEVASSPDPEGYAYAALDAPPLEVYAYRTLDHCVVGLCRACAQKHVEDTCENLDLIGEAPALYATCEHCRKGG